MGCTLSYRGGGGGPDFGVLGILGMSLIGSRRLSPYPINQSITIIHIDYINVHVVQFPMLCYILAHTLSFNLNSYDSIFYLIAVYNLYMVSIHSMTHISFIQYYKYVSLFNRR